jgi:SAM-dependent methyltransferase
MPVTRTEYDAVLYPSAIYQQTHPDRLAMLGRLYGLSTAAVEQCRVLELGCGDGQNLIAAAIALPNSSFVGIDLAELPIEKGKSIVQQLGLGNVDLACKDLMNVGAEIGSFDFIIAHGLYSWVPEAVRERVLWLCSKCLAPHGVAYVSYNAQPGNHMREMARGVMRYHATHFEAREERIRQARGILDFMAQNSVGSDAHKRVLEQESKRVKIYPDAALFHDDLSAVNRAFYFHEFAAAAGCHGLQFLAEADITDMQTDGLSPESIALLDQLGDQDVVTREQYRDFFRARAFRQTLLCHAERKRSRVPDEAQVFKMFLATSAKPTKGETASLPRATGQLMEFRSANNAVIATAEPVAQSILLHLGSIWPQRVHFDDAVFIAEQAHGKLSDADRLALARLFIATHAIGFLDLYASSAPFTVEIGARPSASALARLQLASSNTVATLRHTTMKLEGALSQELVKLLDGTRDRGSLVAEMVAFAMSKTEGGNRDEIQRQIDEQIDANLQHLARGALLVRQ